MSLPSGLLFYLDYTYGTRVGGDADLKTGAAGTAGAETYDVGQSIYNLPTGKGVRSGSLAVGGQYDLAGTTYSRVHKTMKGGDAANSRLTKLAQGAFQGNLTLQSGAICATTGSDAKALQFDPQVLSSIEENLDSNGQPVDNGRYQLILWDLTDMSDLAIDLTAVKDISLFSAPASATADELVKSTGFRVPPQSFQGGSNIS